MEFNRCFKAGEKAVVERLARGGLELSQQPFEVKSRPLRLRSGLDSARLSEMDNDLEIEEFLCKTARLNEHEKWLFPKS